MSGIKISSAPESVRSYFAAGDLNKDGAIDDIAEWKQARSTFCKEPSGVRDDLVTAFTDFSTDLNYFYAYPCELSTRPEEMHILPVIIEKLGHKSKKVRRAAIEEYAKLFRVPDGVHPDTKSELVDAFCKILLEDEDKTNREYAAQLMPIFAGSTSLSVKLKIKIADALFKTVEKDKSEEVRSASLEALGVIAVCENNFHEEPITPYKIPSELKSKIVAATINALVDKEKKVRIEAAESFKYVLGEWSKTDKCPPDLRSKIESALQSGAYLKALKESEEEQEEGSKSGCGCSCSFVY